MTPESRRAVWIAAACAAVAGCSPSSVASGDGDGDALVGGVAGSPGGRGVFSGMGGGASGAPSGGAGTAALGGAGAGGSGAQAGTRELGGTAGRPIAGAGGAGGNASGSGGIPEVGGTGGAAPTFTEIWNRTLENGCATPYCHDGSGKGWSGFDQATAHRTLVAAASTTCPGETRVVPGNPALSVLAAAISHADLGSCDVPTMPRDRPKLSQADIDRILSWIRAGAKND